MIDTSDREKKEPFDRRSIIFIIDTNLFPLIRLRLKVQSVILECGIDGVVAVYIFK